MKLTTIEIEAFRGFDRAAVLDLDADVVVLYGRNGAGKSTVFDAITWCMFGSSKRLGGTRDYSRAEARFITNAFRDRGEERVKLTLRDEQGDITAERRGNEFYLNLRGDILDGTEAEVELLRQLGFQETSDGPVHVLQRRARDSFSRSFLLHQDRLSEFLTSDSPRDRFDAFAELFSLTPIKDFYVHLSTERSRAADQADNLQQRYDVESAQLRQAERQLASENERLASVLHETGKGLSARRAATGRLRQLVQKASDFIGSVAWNETDLVNTIDDALLRLPGKIGEYTEKLSVLRILRDRAPLMSSWVVELGDITSATSDAESKVIESKFGIERFDARIRKLRASVQETERELGGAEAEAQRLQALLSDAIDAVSADECPICQRPIERPTLLAQLRRRRDNADPRVGAVTARRKALNDELRETQLERETQASTLHAMENELQTMRAQVANLRRQIDDVKSGLETELATLDPLDSQIESSIDERILLTDSTLHDVTLVTDDLRSIRPVFELLRTRKQVKTLEDDVIRQHGKVDALARRRQTYSKARDILESLAVASRRAERTVVKDFIRRFRDPIQDAYRWLAPHPLFDELDFEFDEYNEFGELYFTVSDGAAQLNPSTTFSTAQANAVALAVFLSLNVAQRWSPLALTLIDDPIQNQDDINVLSLIDFLRSVSTERQLIVSTSVSHLYRLLMDKLRPMAPNRRLVAHTFSNLLAEGPTIRQEVIEFTPGPRALDEIERLSA